MAVEKRTHRAVNVGLCAGLGVLAPLAAYAATMPYDTVHEIVAAGAAPFAVGAVAGVGALAVSLQVSEHRGSAASTDPSASSGEFERTAAAPLDASSAPDSKRRRRKVKEEGPIIQRAPGAMSDEEAWAELTSLLDDDSPVSCDASRSKGLYEIALEELARTEGTAAGSPAATERAGSDAVDLDSTETYLALAGGTVRDGTNAASNVDMSTGTGSISPESTAVYLSLVEDHASRKDGRAARVARRTGRASRTAASADTTEAYVSIALGGAAAARSHPTSTDQRVPAAPSAEEESTALDEEALCAAARDAAMTSLYGSDVVSSSRQDGGTAFTAHEDASSDGADATDPTLSREEIWAKAIAILEGDDVERAETPRPRGAHFKTSPSVAAVERAMEEQGLNEPPSLRHAVAARMATAAPVDDGTDGLDPGRVAAVTEGAIETAMHERVNELIEEEFDKVPSQSVRRTSREYLRVIQGGTGAMGRVDDERMQAEA